MDLGADIAIATGLVVADARSFPEWCKDSTEDLSGPSEEPKQTMDPNILAA